MSAEAIVQVSDLCKHFSRGSERIDVLLDLNLEVSEGEFLALMGPSGSGKTTLLNLIAGLDRPSEGVIEVGDDRISAMSEGQLARWRTRHVGLRVPVPTTSCRCLTALREQWSCCCCCCRCPWEERKRQVLTAARPGRAIRSAVAPTSTSSRSGQQQRVGIARAIVTDPTLIVADEPTGDLDSKSASEILDLLVELSRGLTKTILMVTHDPRAAARAQRILHLDKGRLVRETSSALYLPLSRDSRPTVWTRRTLSGGSHRGSRMMDKFAGCLLDLRILLASVEASSWR